MKENSNKEKILERISVKAFTEFAEISNPIN